MQHLFSGLIRKFEAAHYKHMPNVRSKPREGWPFPIFRQYGFIKSTVLAHLSNLLESFIISGTRGQAKLKPTHPNCYKNTSKSTFPASKNIKKPNILRNCLIGKKLATRTPTFAAIIAQGLKTSSAYKSI